MPASLPTALSTILAELLDGAPADVAFVLNPGDQGLFESLHRLTAAAASTVPAGGTSSIAAHVDHLRYGLELLNRWSAGEDAFADADYAASWQRVSVSNEEWEALLVALKREAGKWQDFVRSSTAVADQVELNGLIASIVHLAYHLGAIRQIDRATRGPTAPD